MERLVFYTQADHNNAKYVGAGHSDITRHEWFEHQHRDSIACFVGHENILQYMSVVKNQTATRTRYELMQKYISPCGPTPPSSSTISIAEKEESGTGSIGSFGKGNSIDFDGIYLQSKEHKNPGKIKFISNGLGWKESVSGVVITIKAEEIQTMSWGRVARDHQLQILMKNQNIQFIFDGFPRDAHDPIRDYIRQHYSGMYLEIKEYSLKGWNWGKLSIQGMNNQINFSDAVEGLTIMSLPIAEISNAAVTGKNEVSIEAQLDLASKRSDSLVDIRFFVPGDAGEISDDDNDNQGREISLESAMGFVQALKKKIEAGGADLSSIETIASLRDLPFIVPRGRYEMDLYISALRLRGKSYDYKIPYSNISRLFLLPRPDDTHVFLVIALDTPLRQGQTRYPFLIIQFTKEMDTDVDISLAEQARIPLGLEANYEGPQFEVVSTLLKAVSMKKLIVPGQSFQSSQEFCAVKCTVKANEGHLYFLERSFLFVPKPIILMQHEDISSVAFSRMDTSGTTRTFDVKFSMKIGPDHSFSSINKEEFGAFEKFLREKRIRYQNELPEQKKLAYKGDSDTTDDEPLVRSEGGSLDDESSTDEDYQEGDSEEDHSSSSTGSSSTETE